MSAEDRAAKSTTATETGTGHQLEAVERVLAEMERDGAHRACAYCAHLLRKALEYEEASEAKQ